MNEVNRMNIEWKYNITEKELTLKFSPIEQKRFSKILSALNDIVLKGEIVEGEYDITPKVQPKT